MSQEREAMIVRGITPPEPTEEELVAVERAKRRAKLVQVLDRGVTHDRLKVDLPPHLHGEWARNRPEDIFYMQTLGFQVDTEYAPKRALNSNASGEGAVVGDVIFMTCPKEVKEDIDAIRFEQFKAKNGKPGDSVGKEERDFEKNVKAVTGGDIPTTVDSKAIPATVKDVVSAVAAADAQMTPIT